MDSSFKPVSRERAQQIREALEKSRSVSQGLVIDPDAGTVQGVAPLNDAPDEKVNMIGKFDTHYIPTTLVERR